MPKLIHYRDKCIGCGICYELQPNLWRMSRRDGKATLLKSVQKRNVHVLEINEHIREQSYATIEACPAKVIKVN